MIIDHITNIAGERGKDYQAPLPNHLLIAMLWTINSDFNYIENPVDAALKLDLLKTARSTIRIKYDSLIDKVGYVHCVDEMVKHYNKIENVFGKNYEDLTETQKGILVNLLKNLTFSEQADLYIKIKENKNGE